MRIRAVLAATTAVAALAGCGITSRTTTGSSAPPSAQPASTPASSPSAAAPAAQPVTEAAAKSAAETYFALFGAGQYAAVYPMIAPAARGDIRKSVWTGLHEQCRNSASAGLTYKVTHPVLAGDTAVVSVGFAGAAAALGSEQITFTYAAGRWFYQPPDLSVYRHHDLAQAVAAAKAEGSAHREGQVDLPVVIRQTALTVS